MAGSVRHSLVLVCLLTFFSAIIAQFVTQGLGLFLRSNDASSGFIGLLYVASVPYTFRFLWGPIVDRYPLRPRGRYAGWLILTQAVVCGVMVVFFFTQPERLPAAIIALVAIFMVALGFQQTAMGGLIAAGLPVSRHALAASIQGASSAAAGFVLGAVVIYVLADLGWWAVVSALVAIAAAGLIVAIGLAPGVDIERDDSPPPTLLGYFSIFRLPAARRLFAVAVLVNCSIVVPYAAKSLLLIDAGFSISQGALYGIVGGNLAGFVGALAVRPLVERIGVLNVLACAGVLNIIASIFVLFAWNDGLGGNATIALVLFSNVIVFGSFAASRAAILGLCRPGRQATEVASFIGFETVIYFLIAGLGTSMLDSVGLPIIMLSGLIPTALGLFLVRIKPAKLPSY